MKLDSVVMRVQRIDPQTQPHSASAGNRHRGLSSGVTGGYMELGYVERGTGRYKGDLTLGYIALGVHKGYRLENDVA